MGIAAMQELPNGVVPGALVDARGERWRVRQTRAGETAALVTLEGFHGDAPGRVSTLLVPIDRLQPVVSGPPIRRRRRRVIRHMLHAIAGARPPRGLWCAASARMELWPWQLAPALAVLREGATRLLLADAVGLGKTVQAGLVLAELRARGLVDRAMVLAPAAVRLQWVDELRSRFALPALEVDPQALLELGHDAPAGRNPWGRAAIVVSSIDLVKRAEIRAAVEQAPIDLLIVDEAHHATPATDRHAIVSRLARQAAWVVLVSATPHSGDVAAYRTLLDIGSGDRRTPIRVFRREAADVSVLATRRSCTWRVRPSGPESDLQAGVLDYVRLICRQAPAGSGARLFGSVLARRATSSPRSARLTLERRLAWIDHRDDPDSARLLPLPWEEVDPEDGDTSWIGCAGLADRQAEKQMVTNLIERARRAEQCPSKLERLCRFLRRVGEPAIVFSEFRDTLDACLLALEPIAPVSFLHGELDLAERRRRLASFSEGRTRVLLTTDVAGEGLNLQHAARLVVMLEWPWSPLRLAQRIGRVHRIGQRRIVHAVHLTAASSYEEAVVAHVRQRASRAEQALRRADAVIERTVTAAVLDLPPEPQDPTGLESPGPEDRGVDQRALHLEAVRVNRSRALRRLAARDSVDAIWVPPLHCARSARPVVLVEVVQQRPGRGTRGTWLVPVAVSLTDRLLDVESWRDCARRLATEPRVVDAAVAAAVHENQADQWVAVRERLDAIGQRLEPRRQHRDVQPSLFDRRAVRNADHQRETEAARDRWHAALQQRLVDVPAVVSTRVVAVLPLPAGAE